MLEFIAGLVCGGALGWWTAVHVVRIEDRHVVEAERKAVREAVSDLTDTELDDALRGPVPTPPTPGMQRDDGNIGRWDRR